MLTSVIVVLLVLVTLAYAVVPLFVRKGVDPLPDDRDPVVVDLEEERDALLLAIRELDGRLDLPAARREALRARYEAKAAQVLRTLEQRRDARAPAPIGAAPRPATRPGTRRLPWGTLGLLGIVLVTAASLGAFVLPRIGDNTVTTSFESDLAVATALRDLQRAADRDPSVANLMALADAYWGLQDGENAGATYRRVLTVVENAGTGLPPALAYKRLALLAVATDLAGARDLLVEARRVDPTDPETLFALGELSFALGELEASSEAFTAYLATPEGSGDGDARARLELVEAIGPATEALAQDRSVENLMALAEVYWTSGAQDPAVEIYFEVLTDLDPENVLALSRTGELLFIRGRTDDAILVLERAAAAAGGLAALEPQATLFLGNAYVIQGDDAAAVRAWQAHVDAVGFEAAGRVTGLIEAAQARLAGGGAASGDAISAAASPAPATPAPASGATSVGGPSEALTGEAEASAALADPALLLEVGATLYQANCALCHGSAGQGGVGPRLTGNARARDEGNVRSLVRFGRGAMPGFGAVLSEDQVEVLAQWVGQELATPR
ncbi:MAG: c-type cytochrome [Trueperaceae bacterium]|nr:c-type cytochrome [Trueperaceae bacterium]